MRVQRWITQLSVRAIRGVVVRVYRRHEQGMLAARAGGQICCPEPAAPEPHRPEAGDHRLPEAAIGLPYRLLLAHRDGQVEELAQFT